MKAVRYYGRRDMRLDDVPEPQPGRGEVKVEVKFCGICGSDVHGYLEGLALAPIDKPHPQTGRMVPITSGHEFSGVITQLGAGVSGMAVGERVAVRPTMPCYRCHYCRQGKHIQCSILGSVGAVADGAFARYVVVREDCIVPLPSNVTFEAGAYAEPLACAVRAVNRSGLAVGDVVAVVGAGPIGLLTLQTALAAGAGVAYVFETAAHRRSIAAQLGPAAVFDPREPGVARQFAAMTRGLRADVAFECSGTEQGMLLADSLAGRGGTIVSVGVIAEPMQFSFMNLFLREKKIIPSQGYVNSEFEAAVRLLAAGRIQTDPLLTSRRLPLEELLERGFGELIGEQRHQHCKILVSP